MFFHKKLKDLFLILFCPTDRFQSYLPVTVGKDVLGWLGFFIGQLAIGSTC